MRVGFTAAAVAALLLSTSATFAKPVCNWGRWYVPPGGTGVMHVNVLSNKPCTLTRDLRAFGTSQMTQSAQIAAKPSNGVATSSGYLVTYRSRPGFAGQDSFVFQIKGSHNNAPQTWTVRVELVVSDKL